MTKWSAELKKTGGTLELEIDGEKDIAIQRLIKNGHNIIIPVDVFYNLIEANFRLFGSWKDFLFFWRNDSPRLTVLEEIGDLITKEIEKRNEAFTQKQKDTAAGSDEPE